MKRLNQFPKMKITLEELEKILNPNDYEEFADEVIQLEKGGQLIPIVSRGKNGKRPSLHKAYRIIKESENLDELKKELLFLDSRLSNDYYLSHLEQYKEDRIYVQRMNSYYLTHSILFPTPVSYNERSFEIFFREKFIIKESGRRILKNLGLDLEDLNCYETCEPLAYYSVSRQIPQTILFIENKDTYYTIRNNLQKGDTAVFGIEIGTVIYGAGKGIYRSVEDIRTSVSEYVSDRSNTFLYFGDLDYEGILIYETLAKKSDIPICPFIEAYEKMLTKAEKVILPETKEKQNKNISDDFFHFFSERSNKQMHLILEQDRYIPQEIINVLDL